MSCPNFETIADSRNRSCNADAYTEIPQGQEGNKSIDFKVRNRNISEQSFICYNDS